MQNCAPLSETPAEGRSTVCEQIRPMERRDGRSAAELHREGISTGFLTSLGPAFLRQLYRAVPSCPSGFGFVWEEPNGEVLGFITCAESTGRLYKEALLRRGVLMALPLVRFLIRPSVIRRIIQTLRYPAEVGSEMPPAEVLSIAVRSETRGKGVGKALMQAALKEFSRRHINQTKVAVWAGNELANGFYRRCGFALGLTRLHHGLEMNVYLRRCTSD